MNFDLTDEQRLIRDTVRDFARNEVAPVAEAPKEARQSQAGRRHPTVSTGSSNTSLAQAVSSRNDLQQLQLNQMHQFEVRGRFGFLFWSALIRTLYWALVAMVGLVHACLIEWGSESTVETWRGAWVAVAHWALFAVGAAAVIVALVEFAWLKRSAR